MSCLLSPNLSTALQKITGSFYNQTPKILHRYNITEKHWKWFIVMFLWIELFFLVPFMHKITERYNWWLADKRILFSYSRWLLHRRMMFSRKVFWGATRPRLPPGISCLTLAHSRHWARANTPRSGWAHFSHWKCHSDCFLHNSSPSPRPHSHLASDGHLKIADYGQWT